MRAYVEAIAPPVLVGFRGRLSRALARFPDDLDLGTNDDGEKIIVSCHMLARAVATIVKQPRMAVVDGLFGTGYHSWLLFEDYVDWLLDVYPIAVWPGPLLVSWRFSVWRKAYLPGRDFKLREPPEAFERCVRLVTEAFARAWQEASAEEGMI